jgi:benzoate membrane transport protein
VIIPLQRLPRPASPTGLLGLASVLRDVNVAAAWAALTAGCWYAFALVPIQLAGAAQLGLDAAQTSSMLFALWSTAGVATLAFALITRQPVALGASFPLLIYLGSLGDRFSFPELMGGVLIAGVIVLVLGWLRLVGRVIRWVPTEIAMGVFVGSVFGVLTRLVEACLSDAAVAGPVVAGYVLGCALRWRRLPPIGLAALLGLGAVVIGGRFSADAVAWAWPSPRLVPIELSPSAMLAAALPIVLVTLSVSLRGMAVLVDQGYPVAVDRLVTIVGLNTMVNALFGGPPSGLSNEGGAAVAGPEAGPRAGRYVGAALAAILMLGIAVLAMPLAALLHALPAAYMTALVGLGIARVVADGCRRMFAGRLRLAPLATFVVASMSFSLAGLSAVVWALVVGMALAVLVELPELRATWHPPATSAAEASPV